MNFLSRTNGFKFRKTADMTPRQRYTNLDGSLYGSHHILRFLTMPSVKAGALIIIFLAAGAALLESESKRRGVFIKHAAAGLPFVAVPTGISWVQFNTWLPVPKSSVIDKLGYLSSNPAATIGMKYHYKRYALVDAGAAAALYATDVLLLKDPFNPYPFCLLANVAWYCYAAYKLHKGDWTIQTSPPKPEAKRERAKADRLAEVGVRSFSALSEPSRRVLQRIGSVLKLS